ncbi:MAG: P1 family peptidase [Candidatus Velthaea sp.]
MERSGSIVDVAGVRVGHMTLAGRLTGCTVIMTVDGAVGGLDVRGAAPGTRETDLLDPGNLVEHVHAVLLAGGSAFGLDAAAGVMRYLEEQGIGFDTGAARVPIVPAAILYDLALGDPSIRPDAAAGYAAASAATSDAPAEGNVGAGAGATVGKFFGMERAMKSGIGTASVALAGLTVGAIVAVNASGDIIDPRTKRVVAGARDRDGIHPVDTTRALLRGEPAVRLRAGMATTIGVVATDAVLTKAQARKIAQMAHDGLARTIDPVHTMFDGDTIFTLATGKTHGAADVSLLGIMAAEAVARAVIRGAQAARGVAGLPSARDLD